MLVIIFYALICGSQRLFKMAATNFTAPTVLLFFAVSLSLWSPHPLGYLYKGPTVPTRRIFQSLARLESFYPGLSLSYRRAIIHNRPPFCLALTLLFISGTVELNPGPVCKFPCGFCSKPVKSNQMGVQCDSCDVWTCLPFAEVYHGLNNSYVSWICCTCGLPNFSSSLFLSTLLLSCSNLFGPLSESPVNNSRMSSYTDSLFESPVNNLRNSIPLATSTPLQAASDLPQPPSLEGMSRSSIIGPIGSETLNGYSPKILISGNIERARSKSEELSSLLVEERIDILLATETHLSHHVNSCEVLPQDFQVYRKDRPSHKGGVLIAVKNNLVSIPRPDLDSDCEITRYKVLLEREAILIGSYYCPESTGMDSLDALEASLTKVTQSAGNRHVILTGDFNLPSIDWVTSCVPPGARECSS